MVEQRNPSPATASGPAAGPRRAPRRRRSWLLVTLRRTLFWLILLGVLLYAAQLWWLKTGGQPGSPTAPASEAASTPAMPAVSAASAGRHAEPPSGAASDTWALPAAPSASAAQPGIAPAPARPASAQLSVGGQAPAAGSSHAATVSRNGVYTASAPANASSAPTLPRVSEAEVAELAARKLLLPVDGIRPAQLTDTYTQSRGSGRLHEAIDIMAPAGTPVRAVENGRIVKLFTSEAGGLTVYQFDPSGRFGYYYAHLQGYAEGLREGQEVRRGDVIGYVGSSGNASPAAPHLHFAAFRLGPERNWWRGAYLNPYQLWR